MADKIKTGTILIKEGTLLPQGLRFESEPCAPGWSFVKNLDGYGVDRKIHEAGWTFFYLAGEIKATVFGMDGQNMVRRAVQRILKNPKSKRFNSLEITGMTSAGSERFRGVSYVTVSAHLRHAQKNVILFRAKDFPEWDRAELTPAGTKSIGLPRGKELPLEGATMQPNPAIISNS